jgi:hypothetical protein
MAVPTTKFRHDRLPLGTELRCTIVGGGANNRRVFGQLASELLDKQTTASGWWKSDIFMVIYYLIFL